MRVLVLKPSRILNKRASLKKTRKSILKNVEQHRRCDLKPGFGHGLGWRCAAQRARCTADYLKQVVGFANERKLPVHMHVAEQPAEVSACIEEYGRSPVALLATEGLLSERFTGVHVIHVTPKAVRMLADARAKVCACPTTERNLGDGIVPVDEFFKQGVRVALGTDSHVEIDLLEDARELEYHLRLQKMERAVLDQAETGTSASFWKSNEERPLQRSALASRFFECATVSGAESLNAPGGILEAGRAADFFTVDLNDPSIAGASKTICFRPSSSRCRGRR